MISTVQSAVYMGIQALPIQVEIDISNGLPQFQLVGLPDTSIKESKERVRSAIRNSGYEFPSDKITVNLAPADLKKEGPAFDLPIAMGILAANDIISENSLKPYLFLGELALDGSLRPVRGALVIAHALRHQYQFILPKENLGQLSCVQGIQALGARSLNEVVDFFHHSKTLAKIKPSNNCTQQQNHSIDFSEVHGQHYAKRSIEIAIAGGHNILMIGPPGAGKTMLAQRVPTILPPLTADESIQIHKIYSIVHESYLSTKSKVTHRPFRSPHYSISSPALLGGGSIPKPGEISLAHGGILFLDEFPEFKREAIETLRTPLEEGRIHIARSQSSLEFPARFTLIAAMNPCPCGYLTHPKKSCRCRLDQIQKYQQKISGPILDRIDIHIELPFLPYKTLKEPNAEETSQEIQSRIISCRTKQKERFENKKLPLNALMTPADIHHHAAPDDKGNSLLESAMQKLSLSARGYFKILKIARTIADLDEKEEISENHIAEAIQLRSLDRTVF